MDYVLLQVRGLYFSSLPESSLYKHLQLFAIGSPQAVEVAKQVTGDQNETEAVKKFKKILSSPDNFYNKEDFPANESDDQAHRRCRSVEGAKKYCPVRWKALQSWFRDTRIVRSFIFCDIS